MLLVLLLSENHIYDVFSTCSCHFQAASTVLIGLRKKCCFFSRNITYDWKRTYDRGSALLMDFLELLLRCITNVPWNFLITVLSYLLKTCNYILCWSSPNSPFKIWFKVFCMFIYCDLNYLLHYIYQREEE